MMNDELNFNQDRHYYFNGGYIFEAGDDFKIEPSLLLKFVESGYAQWDLYVKGTYKDIVWLAAGYRSDFAFDPNDVVISIGVQQEKIKLGYAYDITLSDIGQFSSGTHEIIFMYMFGSKDKSAYKW